MTYETIEDARRSLGITQDDMAEELSITRQTYAKMEQNPENITIRDARIICSILGKRFGEIFFTTLVNE
jgi:DNA-binding XRE family transcriptional regulator